MKNQLIIKLLSKQEMDIRFSSSKKLRYLVDPDLLKLLNHYKSKLDNEINQKKWDYSKKLTNKYELVHNGNNRINNYNIANYIPISRSYYKLWEILYVIKDKISKNDIKVSTIAEGPGGFMECLINFRNKFYPNKKDLYYGITLKSDSKEVPSWKDNKLFKNIDISYGEDGTGNLYYYNNLIHYINHVGWNECDIVTADGGFDFSVDFNKQEENMYRLLLSEIILALATQKKGGIFVCKFFNMYTVPTIKLYYLLNNFYEYTFIIKPKMSRPANSEKYIVCVNFKGIRRCYLNKLLDIIKYYNIFKEYQPDINITDVFNHIDVNFYDIITKFNNYITKKQIKYLEETFKIINNDYKYDYIKKQHIYYGIKLCKDYEIDVNYNNKYVKSSINNKKRP